MSSGTSTTAAGTIRNVKAANLVTGAVVTLLGAAAAGTSANPTFGVGLNARLGMPFSVLVMPNTSTALPSTLLVTDGAAQGVIAVTCAVCPRGSYCATGGQLGAPLPCPAGVFGGTAGLAAEACSGACTAAPGWACGGGATSAAGAPCPRGFWCPGGAAADPSGGAPCAALSCTTSPFVGNGFINTNTVVDGVGTAAGFAQPRGLKLAPNGNLYVTQDNYPPAIYTLSLIHI